MTPEPAPYDEKDLLGYADPAQYIGLDDRLLVQAISRAPGQMLTVSGRILLVQGKVQPFQFTVPMGDALTLVTFPFQLAQGFIVGLQVNTSETVPCEWWTYVKIGLTRGGGNPLRPFQPLMSGYVGNVFAFGYPRDKNQRPTDGPGVLVERTIQPPDPGTDWTYFCPRWTRQKVLAILATLTTSAVDGDRQVVIHMNGDGPTAFQLAASGTQAASLVTPYNIGPVPVYAGSSALGFTIPLPDGLVLDYQCSIGSTTGNIDAGDQWSSVAILALEWADWA